VRKENHQTFEQLLIDSLEKFIRREAQELLLESDHYESDTVSDVINPSPTSCSRYVVGPNGGLHSLSVPLLQSEKSTLVEASTSFDEPRELSEGEDVDSLVERELFFVRKAKESGVVYLLGHGDIRARKDSWFIKKLVINYFYAFLRKNCRRGIATLSVPHTKLMQVSMTYMV
jgi:hypothetical protein